MKWIKASERLPDEKWYGYLRADKITGTKNSWDQRDDGNIFAAKSMFAEFPDTEWLDESESTPTVPGSVEDAWEWVAIFHGALSTLVELKALKDSEGKTPEYEERQPKAWYAAQQAVELFKKCDYRGKPPALIPVDIEERLNERNPWKEDVDGQCIHAFRNGYTRAVSTLKEILSTQTDKEVKP